MRHRTGYSLIELIFVLLLFGVAAARAVPPLQQARDATAVRAARAELTGALAVARSTAILAGGATLVIDLPEGSAVVETAAGVRTGAVYDIGARYGVSLAAERASMSLRFDALGIGRMANAQLRITRGRQEAPWVVSAYGRVRP
jgi:prepilin-type N-terminal cleavage/methylation domain-containing protein